MERYIIAIDQSTSASKVFLIDGNGEIVRSFSKAHEQFYPAFGYVEHDAAEIWRNVAEGVRAVTEGTEPSRLAALAVCNQRETTVLWDRDTGEPLCRAIVWQDVRSEALCQSLSKDARTVYDKTGLLLSPYYSAGKAAFMLRNDPALRQKMREGRLCIGTMDSYLIHRLTGGRSFRTDVTNASRTQLMNLEGLCWDPFLCERFGIDMRCLAEILPSDGDFGTVSCAGLPEGVPITGVMGDSHASLFGQGCHRKGMAKATFGTGSSVMVNVGTTPVYSRNGLSASVGYGFRGQVCYALEGNVTCSADTLCWLRDEAGLVKEIGDVETISQSIADTDGVYLVPAFSGLGAPYFDGNAKALLYGMNRGTSRAHIVRAALEAVAYQDADVLRAVSRDLGQPITALVTDGGPTQNALLMQFLSDLLACPVECGAASEVSALGVGYMAGMTIGVFDDFQRIPARVKKGKRYQPTMDNEKRDALVAGWLDAVERCR